MWLLEGAHLVCPASGWDGPADVLIDGARVAAVGPPGSIPAPAAARRVALSGCALGPGLVDLFATVPDPGAPHRERQATAARAAAAGGFTEVLWAPSTHPWPADALVWRELDAAAARLPGARLRPCGALFTEDGLGLAEMGSLVDAGAVALGDGGRLVEDAERLRRALEYASPFGVPVLLRPGEAALERRGIFHEGAPALRAGVHGIPAAAEEIGVARVLALVRLTGARVHLTHVSTARAVAALAQAQAEGLPVTGSVPARHLVLSDVDAAGSGHDPAFRVLPPLRPAEDVAAVRAAVRAGVLSVCSDHEPRGLIDKELVLAEAAPGANGFESALAAALTALDGDLSALFSAMAVRPAAVRGRRAAVEPGAPADLVVLEPGVVEALAPPRWSLGRAEPLVGRALRGRVRAVFVAGQPGPDSIP